MQLQNTEKEEIKIHPTAINPKLANTMLIITTLTILHKIAKRNGFYIFDLIGEKLSSKKNNDYGNGFY